MGPRGADTAPARAGAAHAGPAAVGRCGSLEPIARSPEQDPIGRIDLSTLDANAGSTATNEAFSFIGSAAYSADATGQLRYVYSSTNGYGVLYGSTDADIAAEFAIQVTGVSTLAATDFWL